MKKGKIIFSILFTLLLTTLGASCVSLYDNARENNRYQYDYVVQYYQEEFQLMSMQLASQMDTNYQTLTFGASLSNDEKEYLISEWDFALQRANNYLTTDEQLFYIAKSLDGEVLTNLKSPIDSIDYADYGLNVTVSFDSQGNCQANGDQAYGLCNILSLDNYIGYYDHIGFQKVTLNNPTNLSVTYLIPKNVTTFTGIFGEVDSWTMYNGLTLTLCLVSLAILSVVLVIYPMRYVSLCNPFKIVCAWSFEWNFIIWSIVLTFLYSGLIVLVGTSINGQLLYIVNGFGLNISNNLLMIINIGYWMLTLLCSSVVIYLLKYIIVSGPIHYIKEHTAFVCLLRWIHNKLISFTTVDIDKTIAKKLLTIAFINSGMIIFCAFINPSVGLLVAIIYSLISLVFVYKKGIEVQDNYHQLMNAIECIITQDFDSIDEKELGIFASSKLQLMELSDNVQNAISEQVKSQKLKTELISNVSHDLKTPLTCIKNYIALLDDDKLNDEDRKHYVEQLKLYANRLKRLIEDLFEISKVDSGNIQLNYQALDIVSLLEQVMVENEDLLETKHIEIIKKLPADKIILNLDSDKTYRIFENLFTNISKYALSNSRAYISITSTNDEVLIEFSNISEQPMDFTAQEITERFVRGDKSRSQQGSGLGLAIARSFTEVQGGTFNLSIDCDLFKAGVSFPLNSQ